MPRLYSGLPCPCISSVSSCFSAPMPLLMVLLCHHFWNAFPLVPLINLLPPNSSFIAFSGKMDLGLLNIFPLPTDMMLTLKSVLEERHRRKKDFSPGFNVPSQKTSGALVPSPPCSGCEVSLEQWLPTRDNFAPRGHMAINKNSFQCHNLASGEVLLPASSE